MLLRKTMYIYTISLFLSLMISFSIERTNMLLHFINSTFYLASGLIIVSSFLFTTKKGFFDAITISFRKVLPTISNRWDRDDLEEMSIPSELVSFNISAIFTAGMALLATMLLSLLFFYY
ncbi:DUF3899 domain-containing protein [Bacillus carboniphilus]|uniref:DUF3899 domain-containing protein n=1 Tax=Bacillus carboniphilus TaxID=86663 RepID=A0ABY9JWZ5_9BACI|nr:DUF3899 domain-containing protein [Bacillus carboniphilus]WLR42945.1 DUF3899 domain-containing protein [Bacillus carboniphilus]